MASISSSVISSRVYISNGELAYSNKVNDGGRLYVDSGGTANSTKIYGGELVVANGGTANNTVNSGGYLTVSSGGKVTDTILNGGFSYVYGDAILSVCSGGTATNTTVNSYGRLVVKKGGSAIDFNIAKGGMLNFTVAPNTYIQGTSNGVSILFDSAFISHYTITHGYISVESGGKVTDTILNGGNAIDGSGATLIVSSGGTANFTTLKKWGKIYISSGGTANFTTVNSGYLDVYSSGIANDTTVNSGGRLYVDSGGTALRIKENGGYIHVGVGAGVTFAANSFSGLVLSYGTATVHSGTTANNTTVNSYGDLSVYSGGTANSTTVNSSGHMYVSGGTANETTINSFGGMAVSSGGTANSTTVNFYGDLVVSSGGTANNTTVNYCGYLHVSSGGTANDTTVNSGGYLLVSSGGSANNTMVTSVGHLHVSSGGTANSTTVNSYGYLYVHSGTANETTVNSGGVMDIDKDALVRGLQIEYGATVRASAGAEINFDLTNRIATDPALVHNHYLMEGNPDYTISVSSTQESGDYILADNVTFFAAPITITTTGGVSDSLTVGSSVELEEQTYTLNLSNNELTLTVLGTEPDTVPPEPPVASANVTTVTNRDVTVSAVFSNDSAEKQYSFDNTNWNSYTTGAVKTENGTVYFRGIDAAGNISDVTAYSVTNIDKVAPVKPTASANITAPTNQNVTVTAVFSDDSAQKQYSLNGTTWNAYTAPVVMSSNGTVYFRGMDAAGNISEITSYAVTNIQKVTPDPVFPDQPDAPGKFTVSVSKYNATLSWNKVTAEKGVKVSYEIWIDGRTVKSTSNKYTLKNAAVGTHSFKVRTKASNGEVSNWSDTVIKTIADITAPKAGTLTVNQTNANSIQLDWTAASDNVGIHHYIVTCGSDSKEVSGSSLSAEFSGVAGKLNATLIAYDAAGNASKTVKKTITLKDVTPPTKVTGLYAEEVNNKSGGVLTWEQTTDNVGVTQYLISVEDENGKKTSYKSKTNSVKVKKMPVGEYKFTVVAVDKSKNQSVVSEECVFAVEDVIDPKVSKLTAKVTNDSALVTWSATDETCLESLELSLDGKEPFEVTGLGSYTFSGLSVGDHKLLLTAYDAAGNCAVKEVKVSVKAPKGITYLAGEASDFLYPESRYVTVQETVSPGNNRLYSFSTGSDPGYIYFYPANKLSSSITAAVYKQIGSGENGVQAVKVTSSSLSGNSGKNKCAFYTEAESTYLIEVSSSKTVSYELVGTLCESNLRNNTFESAEEVNLDDFGYDNFDGFLSSSDTVDFYRFHLADPETVKISAWVYDSTKMTLFDAQHKQIASRTITWTTDDPSLKQNLAAGDYYLKLELSSKMSDYNGYVTIC